MDNRGNISQDDLDEDDLGEDNVDSRGNKSKDDLDDTHLHLEHLLRLLRRLELEGDLRKEKFFCWHKKIDSVQFLTWDIYTVH